jgi:hypothetical protein
MEREAGTSGLQEIATPRHGVENWIVALVVLASGIAALIHIQSTTIWYDEALTLLVTSGHGTLDWAIGMQQFKPTANLSKILSELYRYDVHPPLYFWTLAIWRVVFGGSLEAARWLSALFTLATLGLMYRYAIEIGIRWPSAPVVIYAVSSAGLRYAYNARSYAMATFLIVLTLFLAHRKSKWAGICGAACVATHYFAGLCVGPILAMECFVDWKTDKRWAAWTASSFTIFCSPLVLLVAKHVGARPHQIPPFGNLRKEIDALLFAAVKSAMPGTTLGGLEWRLALLFAAVLAVAGGIWTLRRGLFTIPFAYAGFLCGFLVLSMVTHKSIARMPNDYYLGISAPLFAFLLAYGVNAFPLASPALALVLIAGTVTTTPMMMPSSNFRAMANEIRPECNHCALLAAGPAVPACVLYEAKGMDVFLLKASDTPDAVVQRVGRGRTIYLITSNEADTAPLEQEIVQSFPSLAREGYFKVDTTPRGRQ